MKRFPKKKKEKKLSFWKKLFFLFCFFIFLFSFFSLRGKVWNQRDQYNFALNFEDMLLLLAVSPEQKTIFLVSFPGKLRVNAFGDYGEFALNKISSLARQEKREQIFAKTIEYNFAFPLDGAISLDRPFGKADRSAMTGEELFPLLKKETIRLAFSGEKIGLGERVNLILLGRSLEDRSYVQEVMVGEEEGFVGNESQLNRERWDSWAGVFLADSALMEERIAVAVYNCRGRTGVANETARVLEGSGMAVVVVKDSDKEVNSCLLGLKNKEDLKTATGRRMKNTFPFCDVDILPENDFSDLSEINLYLGKEFLAR